jgi:FixJ family two-component response regulator
MSSAKPIIYVVDDDSSVRQALASLIGSVGWDVAAFASAREFLDFPRPDAPACLVLDLKLPDIHGLELQAKLGAEEAPPIVFITGHGDIPSSVRAIKAGAVEFLTKPFREDDLLKAIETAIQIDGASREKRAELNELKRRHAQLTPRERQVLPFVVAGCANKETAADLGITEATIGVHRGQIMRKMQARSLAELVRMAEKLSIGTPGPRAKETSNSKHSEPTL